MIEGPRAAMKAPSLRRQKLVLWLAFLIIVLVSALAFYSTQRLIAASERVERTQNMLVETNRFLSEIRSVESSSRGYYVTGDERYLKIRAVGLASARITAARLRMAPASDDLRQRLDRFIALAEQRLEYSNRFVRLRGSPASALQSLHLGSNVMDRVRSDAETIISTQTNAYRSEQLQLERQARLTSLALAVGVALCLGAIGWLCAIRGREVAARRHLEEELRGLNVELEDRVQERASEVKRASDLLNTVVESLPDTVILKEAADDFKYLLINAAGERLFGRDRDEILGRIDHELFPREQADLLLRDSKEVATSGRMHMSLDRKFSTPIGIRTVESRNVPIANGSGAPGLILNILRDVTSAKAIEEQLRQLQRIDAIGRLTGGVAHDFNNLLAIIHGNSELIRTKLEDGTETAEMADDVVNASARGAELVRRLLAFARMQHLEPEAVDLGARLSNVVALLERSLGEKINVRVKAAKKLWHAIVDPTQVDDALVNLAINARDAMPNGGTLTIETQNVTLDEDYAAHHVEVTPGDYVMMAVSDTGTGMTPEVIARAFEPFFTTKEEGQGTGLGLSQVFGWVKQSGGHIKIYSELGHGTTIKLYLPRAKSHGDTKVAEPDVATPQGDETIFVVEDNPNVRRTVIRQLHDLGYRTIEAESGAEAIRRAREGAAFDLLLTDVVMPGGMTGYQLADKLRIERADIRVLFTSGYTELAAATGQAARKEALLSKPYRKQDLGRAVRLALDTPAAVVAE